MKKVLLLSSILALGCAVNANPAFNTQVINEFQSFQGQNVRDMNYATKERLKHDEYTRLKNIQELKDKENKGIETQEPAIKRIFNRKPVTEKAKFVEEDGQIKIESSN